MRRSRPRGPDPRDPSAGLEHALDRLRRGAEALLGRPLTPAQVAHFRRYLELLLAWNRIHRLVGSSDPTWIADKLLLDSLLFLEVLPPGVSRIADLGSGAGIPGIPLKIVHPRLKVVLIEARQRRASFLKTVVRDLALQEVGVVDQRVPGIAGWPQGGFDAVVARCAGDPRSVAEVGLSLVRAGGSVVIAASPSPRPGQPGRWIEVRGRHFLVVSEGQA